MDEPAGSSDDSALSDAPETSEEAAEAEAEAEEEKEGHGSPEGPLAYTTEREVAALPPYLQKSVTRKELNDAIARINRHLPEEEEEANRQAGKENQAFAPLAYHQLDEYLPGGAWFSCPLPPSRKFKLETSSMLS